MYSFTPDMEKSIQARMCVILCDSLRLEGGLRVLICVR